MPPKLELCFGCRLFGCCNPTLQSAFGNELAHILVLWLNLEIKADQILLVRPHQLRRDPVKVNISNAPRTALRFQSTYL